MGIEKRMITAIFENLFKPISDDEKAVRVESVVQDMRDAADDVLNNADSTSREYMQDLHDELIMTFFDAMDARMFPPSVISFYNANREKKYRSGTGYKHRWECTLELAQYIKDNMK